MNKALVIGDSRLCSVHRYQTNKKPSGYQELDIMPFPGATIQDVLNHTKKVLENFDYSLVYISAGVNNLTRMTGLSVIPNETFLKYMPVNLISICQIFLNEMESLYPDTKFVFCPVLGISLDKYNCHIQKKTFTSYTNNDVQSKINCSTYQFSKYMKNTVNFSFNVSTPEYEKGIVSYTRKKVIVNYSKFHDGLHLDQTVSINMYNEFLRCKRLDF